jgi:Secretion system C-terminal sorting domain
MLTSLPTLFTKYLQILSQSLHKLRLLFVLLLMLSVSKTHAQVNSYGFTTNTGTALETGGFTTLLSTFLDDDVSALANIGFTFTYGGTNYTQFSVTSNGLFEFGASAVTDYNNVFSGLTGPYLIPYWDDNYTDADGSVQYKLMGVAGSRKLVVNYNLSYLGNTGTADKHFQIWLFETTNIITFAYGAGNNLNGGFSVGILTNGTNNFVSVSTATHTKSIVTANDNNTTWPGAGRAYVFNAAGTLPVTFLNFSGYKDGNKNQLQWATATEINNLGFEIQRSTDGINYSLIGFINSQAANGNSSNVLNYRFTDNNGNGNRQYYRLRQIDINTNSKLSSIIRIDGDKPLLLKIDGVFPNPATTVVNIMVSSPGKDKITFSITDVSGRMLLQKQVNVETGRNTFPIDISQLANTTYMLKVTTASGNNESFKIAVVK